LNPVRLAMSLEEAGHIDESIIDGIDRFEGENANFD